MDRLHHQDCLVGLAEVPDGSVHMVFADLPYGVTQNRWDSQIPLEPLWAHLRRVCVEDAAMVFTAMQPFTSLLVTSNLRDFRYSLVWRKNKPHGHLNAKRQPMREHEDIIVFYRKQPKYRPQMTTGHKPVHRYTKHTDDGANYGATRSGRSGGGQTTRYPTSVLDIPVVNGDDPERVHPTQKPTDLPAWFIRTYTNPGDVVLDPAAGSATTLVAARDLGRGYIGFESDAEVYRKAFARLARR